MESLRQLAARLERWLESAVRRIGTADSLVDAPSKREHLIREFVRRHHDQSTRLEHLANAIGLSPSRTAHVVREATGSTFSALLHEARTATATLLLTQTDLPLKTVAARSGFDDLSYFHRVFRRQTGLTPLVYRRRMGI
jgi:AraC-like DNA-binding protein